MRSLTVPVRHKQRARQRADGAGTRLRPVAPCARAGCASHSRRRAGAGGDDDPYLLSWRGIASPTYYMTDTARYVQLLNYSGCGNTVSGNQPVTQRMIVDSLRMCGPQPARAHAGLAGPGHCCAVQQVAAPLAPLRLLSRHAWGAPAPCGPSSAADRSEQAASLAGAGGWRNTTSTASASTWPRRCAGTRSASPSPARRSSARSPRTPSCPRRAAPRAVTREPTRVTREPTRVTRERTCAPPRFSGHRTRSAWLGWNHWHASPRVSDMPAHLASCRSAGAAHHITY